LVARSESQSISYEGYLVRAKPAASSHGASLKSSCCISRTSAAAVVAGEGDDSADSREDDASSEDGEEQLLVGVDEVAAAVDAETEAVFLAFLEAVMFWQRVWSLASTEACDYPSSENVR
jgi:hypothetical protein